MRRFLAVAVTGLAILGMLAPPVFAQPAPKVTMNGLVDFVASAYQNWSGADADVTSSRDHGFYSRERGVFTLTGEVGKSKGVWAVELDFSNGAGLQNGSNAFGGNQSRVASSGVTSPMDLDTDVASAVETKWLYLETPLTGPGSILPFIPVPSIVRGGAQPARGHEYKNGILFGGDFPGVTIETTWAPNLRSTITFAQIAEKLDQPQVGFSNQSEDIAFLVSVEMDVFKGLTVKPTYAYVTLDGGNCGTSNLGIEGKNGFDTSTTANSIAAGNPHCPAVTTVGGVGGGGALRTERHTFGGDVRWTMGPFSFQPTFLYQVGTQEVPENTLAKHDVKIRSWIFDTTAGFRAGPLNVEGRFMWTPGMGAQFCVTNCGAGAHINAANIRYYQPINSGFGYMAGWSDIWTGGIDYGTALLVPAGGLTLRQGPSYDKYGRMFVAAAVDYALTPALTLKGLANVSWTDEPVDTSGVITNATGLSSPRIRGTRDEESYLGTEVNLGLTYRFAPNVAFDLVGAYLFAGDALNHARTGSCTTAAACKIYDAQDVWKFSSRVRLTF